MKTIVDAGLPLDEVTTMFEYLDELRDSGVTNMMGARPYLIEEFDLDGERAGTVLSAWMKTFSHNVSAPMRATAAFNETAAP